MVAVPNKTDWFTPLRFALLLALLVGGSFPGILTGRESFVLRDYSLFGYPLAYFHRSCFWNGELPFWNPYHHCGMPFLAQWNTLCLYPLSLIYLLPPLTWGLGLFCVLHLHAGGLGMYWLARERTGCGFAGAVAGVLYAFNGLTQTALMWPNNIAALGWLPWVLLLLDRGLTRGGRWLYGAALAGGLQMLSGAPELILMTWGIGVLCWLARGRAWRTESLRLAGVVGLVTALAAIQLLPFLDLLARSNRGGAGLAAWALAADGWCNLFVPLFRTIRAPTGFFAQVDQFWTLSYYAGIGGLLFALSAWRPPGQRREVAIWWLLGLAALGLAVGERGVLYPLVAQMLPVGLMRYPVKFVAALTVVIPVLAAFGVAGLVRHQVKAARWPGLEWVVVAGMMGLVMTGIPEAAAFGELRRDWMDGALGRLLVLAGIALAMAARSAFPKAIWGTAVLLVCFLDLKTHSPGLVPVVPGEVLASSSTAVVEPGKGVENRFAVSRSVERVMRQGVAGDHVAETRARGEAGLPNLNLLRHDASVGGFYSLRLAQEYETTRRLHQNLTDVHPPLADFLGISRVAVADERGLSWRTRSSAEALVTIGREVKFATDEQVLRHLASDAYEPRREVFLTPESRDRIDAEADATAFAKARRTGVNRLEIETSANRATVAVIARSWHPNWSARMDGEPVELLRVNHAFQGVAVPAGEHRIELVYRDRDFLVGVLVSGLALAGIIRGLWSGPKKKGGPMIEPPVAPNLI